MLEIIKESLCTEINTDSVDQISQEIEKEGGSVIFVDVTERLMRARIELFDRPKISRDHHFKGSISLSSNRGYRNLDGDTWGTGLFDNRSYSLRAIPEPTGDRTWDIARSFFESLDLGNGYQFQIHVQSTCCMGVYPKDTDHEYSFALYIPPKKRLDDVFNLVFTKIAEKIKIGFKGWHKKDIEFDQEAIKKIVKYIISDLKTNKIVMKNMAAGMEADAITGM